MAEAPPPAQPAVAAAAAAAVAPQQQAVQTRNPKILYKLALNAYVNKFSNNGLTNIERKGHLRALPPIVLMDIYKKMASLVQLHGFLFDELTDLDNLMKLLKFGASRQKALLCLSKCLSNGLPVAQSLASHYILRTKRDSQLLRLLIGNDDPMPDIDCGLRIGSFLAEAGCLAESTIMLETALRIIKVQPPSDDMALVQLDCLQRLLHSQAGYCCFKEADRTFVDGQALISEHGIDRFPSSLLANWYVRVSVLFFAKSDFHSSYTWSLKALEKLEPKTPDRITIDVLRQAAKSCVLKRHFRKANILLVQALKMAKSTFGRHHQKFSDALLDYGFFMLNVDSIAYSVSIYKEALGIKKYIFGTRNLNVAIAEEDLSYALYVCEYSSGRFDSALAHVRNAVEIMYELLPNNHLMIASAKRVKALILEEIALDHITPESTESNRLLDEAEQLHRSALQLSLEAFGEVNVLTAKHYGNLGRLYQTMTKYEEAEKMHQRAIKIKTDILGAFDYEVGLSIGHLASLYNYHMNKHREAEKLYLRSISISLKMFGESYSGLEYDYRGLCHVYESLQEIDKYLEYQDTLDHWKLLREGREEENKTMYEFREESSLEEVTRKFFEMCSEPNAMSIRS